jgi:hypothetical protein
VRHCGSNASDGPIWTLTELILGTGMKFVIGLLLLVLSGLLGVAVAFNVYFILATAGSSNLRTIGKPNYLMLGILAALASSASQAAFRCCGNAAEKSSSRLKGND